MADIYSLTIRADTRDVTRAKQALDGLSTGAIRATRTTDSLAATVHRTNARAFRPMKGAVQQAGFQIGDFATQVGAGQNALIAFSQQASQMAQIFGPGGAVLGAVIAIGGAIAGGLVRAFSEGGEEARKLSERILEVAESTDELTESQARALRLDFFANNQERLQKIVKERERIRELNEQIAENERLMERPAGQRDVGTVSGILGTDVEGLQAQTRSTKDLEEQNRDLRNEITKTQASIDTYFQSAEAVNDKINEVVNGTGSLSDSNEDAQEKITQLVSALQAQADTVGMTARETAIYEATRLGATAAEIEAINAAFDQIEAEQQRQQAIKESTKANQEFEQSWEKLQGKVDPVGADLKQFGQDVAVIQDAVGRGLITPEQADEMVNQLNRVGESAKETGSKFKILTDDQQDALSTVGSMFGNFAEIAQAGGEDAFQAYKNFASAEAAIAASLAAIKTLAEVPYPLNIAAAASIGALAAVQIAQIQSQEYQGARALGGSVSSGSSYLVGERGPEIVTMGGSGVVTPSAQMNAANDSGDVIVNINNAPQGTRTETRTDDQGNRFVDVFVADMASGGPMSRSIQSTYGVRRQGR